MPRFDPEIIAALADGTIAGERAAALEREIGADPVAAAELRAQRAALAAIGAATTPELTSTERTALRAAVAEQLGLERGETAEPHRRRTPWGSVAVAAAALLGVIAVVPVVGLLSTDGGDDNAGATLPAAALEQTETGAPNDDDGLDLAETSADEPPIDTTHAPATSATTMAAAGALDDETTVTADGEQRGETTTTAEAATTTTAAPATTVAETVAADDAVAGELSALRGDQEGITTLGFDAGSQSRCYAEAVAAIGPVPEGGRIVGLEHTFEVGVRLAYFAVDAAGSIGSAAVLLPDDCTLIALVP